MTIDHPDSNELYPIKNHSQLCFLKNVIQNPKIIVGDYTYYHDLEGDVGNFEKNVLYLFDFMDNNLLIGKFCQIASGVRFIMGAANHPMNGISTYPFKVFEKSWKDAPMNVIEKGDTIIGNDVWIGNSATIMPGVRIGDGAIIGTNALVTKDVEPYTVVGGNPAQVIRNRFDTKTTDFLVQLAWWNWPVEKITENLPAITSGDVVALRKI